MGTCHISPKTLVIRLHWFKNLSSGYKADNYPTADTTADMTANIVYSRSFCLHRSLLPLIMSTWLNISDSEISSAASLKAALTIYSTTSVSHTN